MRVQIVETILDAWQTAELQLDDQGQVFPLEWEGKRSHYASLRFRKSVANNQRVHVTFRRRLAVLFACVALCQSSTPVAGANAAADIVFVQCSVLQGNGYNWAATLGWLAGQVEIVAVQAQDYETRNPGRSARIDLACVTGSSSGGFAAALFDHLLHNPRLVGQGAATGLPVSPATAREISRALMFLALSTDFRGEGVTLAFTAAGARAGLLDRVSNPAGLQAWRAASTPTRVYLQPMGSGRELVPAGMVCSADGGTTPVPVYRKRSSALVRDAAGPSDKQMRILAARARRIVSREISGRILADRPPSDGFCATSLAAPIAEPTLQIEYDALRLVVGCNATTFAAFVRSQGLARWLSAGPQMADRLLLARFDSWWQLLDITVREPEPITPLTGGPDLDAFGIDAVVGFNGARFAPREPAAQFLVLGGGFAGPRLQAWPATALLADRMTRLRAADTSVQGRIGLFGRTERRSDPDFSFAQRAIHDYFARDGDALAALTAFHAWQDEYCVVVDALPSDMSVDFYRMD